MINKKIVLFGSILFATAIILGAFGAHALKDLLSADKLQSFEVGVRYQFYLSLVFLIFGILEEKLPVNLRLFYIFQISGVLMFSGSIYLLSIEQILSVDLNFLGPVTPLGGLMLILGWIIFIVRLIRFR
jgi:uncharacterized membrane protein YgdD (TMEM256/DUF423 family)